MIRIVSNSIKNNNYENITLESRNIYNGPDLDMNNHIGQNNQIERHFTINYGLSEMKDPSGKYHNAFACIDSWI